MIEALCAAAGKEEKAEEAETQEEDDGSKALFHFLERPKNRIRNLLTERSPSLLAPRFSAFSKISRLSSKQLMGDTVSLSRDSLSNACNIRPDNDVFRLLASAFRRAFCAVGTLIESVSVIEFIR